MIMKFEIQKYELLNALNTVSPVVSKKSSMDIIKGIYLKCWPGLIEIKATDLALSIKTEVYLGQNKIDKPGEVVFPLKFVDIINALPSDKIFIEVDDNYQATIKCKNSKFKMSCLDADQFPELPTVNDPEKINVDMKKLNIWLNKVLIAVSNNKTDEPFKTGVLFENNYMVATDIYKMSVVKTNINMNNKKVVLPADSLKVIKKIINGNKNDNKCDLDMIISNNYVKFIVAGAEITTSVIETNYPNYKNIIPEDFKTEIKVDRKLLADAIKRLMLVSDEKIKLSVGQDENLISVDYIEIETYGDGKNESAKEIVPALINGEQKQVIAVNDRYLFNCLQILDSDEVNVKLINGFNPICIIEENFTHLIMPLRTN